jgi:murein DD-endopeptidase MepM/ murein hydrolase activator NlpD
VPAIGSRAAEARTRSLRLIGLAVALLFLLGSGAAWAAPVEARDWTPQIKATRRAQIYWEDLMREADKELRVLKKTKKRTVRKLKRIEANLEKAMTKRGAAKRRLAVVRADLDAVRVQVANRAEEVQHTPSEVAPPPRVELALQALLMPTPPPRTTSATALEAPFSLARGPVVEADPAIPAEPVVDAKDVTRLRRDFRKAKRSYLITQRKARRSQRNWHTVKARVRALKTQERAARSQREKAERNLGSWVLAMTRYGRIRAVKKSDARPGVTTKFSKPVVGRISQGYHAAHDGIDIVRYKGAPIRAMAFGVVTYVGWNPWDQHGRAFMVVVTHAGGYETLYGHLQPKRVVRVGEEVKKGHIIGYMGNTGNSTGPHLHVELRRGRTTLDPQPFL